MPKLKSYQKVINYFFKNETKMAIQSTTTADFFFVYSDAKSVPPETLLLFTAAQNVHPFWCCPCKASLYIHTHLEQPRGTVKSTGTPELAGTKMPLVLKFSSKGAETDHPENPRKLSAPRADVTGQSGGFDTSPLSCTKIER